MNLLYKIFYLVLLLASSAFANELCPRMKIPQDREVSLSVNQQRFESSEAWIIRSIFVVNKTPTESFEFAKKIEKLEHIVPLINVFNLSEDRKTLEVGIRILPALSFRQIFQIAVLENNQLQLQFTEGSFAGLTANVCFISVHTNQTAVIVNSSGNLKNNPVPFFVTNSMLEAIGKSIIRRWRSGIESQDFVSK